ncbi:hypothetical protein [Acinetobacter pittii]|uniref:hypothetical protein n=1 Tax=Acinetobacter pittii TaxID=48296 RepID=UPI001D0828C8|nr:hypothetical protein [Acinetobacter pittii]
MTYEPITWKCCLCGVEIASVDCLFPYCKECRVIKIRALEYQKKQQMLLAERIKDMELEDSLSHEEAWTVFVLVLIVFFLIALGGFYLIRWLA